MFRDVRALRNFVRAHTLTRVQLVRPIDDDSVLRWLTEGTAATTGHQFFRALVQGLCGALGTKGAWVSAYLPKTRQLRANIPNL